ncbi:MAG TPA: sulfite exporter TauE/SafE family protein [Candidatus Dormibacteraeota bacterium]|nr:sulfite exporter TauE/SafE family protein [Candidatus Dormibacteraeota bacterium]
MSWADGAATLGGLVAGLLSGAIGIGGGLAFVPILKIGFRTSQTIAQGTSLAAIIPTAIVGGVTHIRQGNAVVDAAAWLGGAGVLGAIGGALIAVHLEGGLLARVFGVFYIGASLLMLRRGLSQPASPEPDPAPPTRA